MELYRIHPSVHMSPKYSGSHGQETHHDSRHNVSRSEGMINSSPQFSVNGGGTKRRSKRKKYKRRTSKIRKKYKRRTSKIRKKY